MTHLGTHHFQGDGNFSESSLFVDSLGY